MVRKRVKINKDKDTLEFQQKAFRNDINILKNSNFEYITAGNMLKSLVFKCF